MPNDPSKRIDFLRPPGSGKGTQAELLSEYFELFHISTGEMLRSAIEHKTPLGEKAQAYVERGELVPDDLLLNLINQCLADPSAVKGWILDGFPRTVNQAIFLDEILDQLKGISKYVVNLEVPDEVLIERLLQRGRSDDSEEIIRRRLEVYYQQTEPVLNYYQSKGQLNSVDGNRPSQSIASHLQQMIQA